MSEQDGNQISTLRRPAANDNQETWVAYWKEQGQAWRTEPEIDSERQMYLAERRSIIPNIERGIYPFKKIKLTRADVEWLLATHENGRGPVDWSDESQRNRTGIDLRGSILNKENLSGLPLACMLGGLGSNIKVTSTNEAIATTTEQRAEAAIHMEGTNLSKAHLEGANFSRSHLNRANIRDAHLKGAEFFYAHLEKAYLSRSHLEGAILRGTHLEGTVLYKAHLEGTELRRVFLNNETNLEDVSLGNKEHGYALLADVSWGDANLAVIDWSKVVMLGDEQEARDYEEEIHQKKTVRKEALKKERKINERKRLQKEDKSHSADEVKTMLEKFQASVRANRQLTSVLQAQGMNEAATHFAYNAQVLRRQMLLLQIGSRQSQIFLSISIVLGLMAMTILILISSFAIAISGCGRTYGSANQCLKANQFQSLGFLTPPLGFLVFLFAGFMLLASIPIVYTRFTRHQIQSQVPFWQISISLLPVLGGLILLFISFFVYLPSFFSSIISSQQRLLTYLPPIFQIWAWVFFLFLIPTFLLTFFPLKNQRAFKLILSLSLLLDFLLLLFPLLFPQNITLWFSTSLEALAYTTPYSQCFWFALFITVLLLPPLYRMSIQKFRILIYLIVACMLMWLFILGLNLETFTFYGLSATDLQRRLLQLGLSPAGILFVLALFLRTILSAIVNKIKRIKFLQSHLYQVKFIHLLGNQLKTQLTTFKEKFWERFVNEFKELYIEPFKDYGQYSLSLFLDALAGYGYKPGRSLILYLLVICGFATTYAAFGHLPILPDSFVFSLTSFHGRGFFPGLGDQNSLHNPMVVLASIEAVVGLVIEISFIATFTQRFFGK